MKIVNLEDIEDFILSKHEIDLCRIKYKEISEKTNYNDFLVEMTNPDYVYFDDKNNMICIKLYKTKEETYIFISGLNKNIDTKKLYKKLMHFDPKTLIKLSYADQFNEKYINGPKYIKGNDIYIEKTIHEKYKS